MRAKTAESTRVHLVASALLVVCLIRQKKLDEAERLITKVMEGKPIRESVKRREFIESVARRYELESFFTSVKGLAHERLKIDEIDAAAVDAMKRKSEEELYAQIGSAIPSEVIAVVCRVNRVTRLQLTAKELHYLPPPAALAKEVEQGRSFFESLKLVIWRSLCDPKSDVYKAWYTDRMASFYSKKFCSAVVVAALVDIEFAAKAIAIPVAALLMKIGIEVYCERFKPGEIIDGRSSGGE